MRIDKLWVRKFRNLRDFSINFSEEKFTTVLIGENGTGKSNVLECITLIFRALDLAELPEFDYDVSYECRGEALHIKGRVGRRQEIRLGAEAKERITWTDFQSRKDMLLPKYIFAYYSGPSNRMRSYFEAHQKKFYDLILHDDSGDPPPIRRLFYCQPEHSRWVLLAYFLRQREAPPFLRRYFGIEAFDSALLVLHHPEWARDWLRGRRPPEKVAALGDPRFWWARGVVKSFLGRLWDRSLAPIVSAESYSEDYRSNPSYEERVYLYLPSAEALQNLSTDYRDEAALFAALESTDISQLVRDVRVRALRDGESILFSEMSEGEQQLLTVVGLMQFTRHEESLFLLDEPDTHLNPIWKLRYLRELALHAGFALEGRDEVEGDVWLDQSSQLILTTHDPLTIAGLTKEEVQIFERHGNQTAIGLPSEDPRGLGVAGVLIEMFGLPTTLDLVTQRKIERRNSLTHLQDRSPENDRELEGLTSELNRLGLAYDARDPEYRQYLRMVHEWEMRNDTNLEKLAPERQNQIVWQILDSLMAGRG